MEIISINVYGGINAFSYKPAVRMLVDLKELCDTPTKDIEGFNKRLIELFPGFKKHKCALGYEGGFLDRMKEGTYLAHVTEHLILEMQNLLGCDVKFGKARQYKDSQYYVIYQHTCEQTAEAIGRLAVEIVNGLIDGNEIKIEERLMSIKAAIDEYTLGPSTAAICDEATSRGIPVLRIGNRSLLQLGYGCKSRMIQATISDDISCLSADLASDKYNTKRILSDNGLPVPCGTEVFDIESAELEAEKIGYPVVVKPLRGNQGKGVTANIKNSYELRKAFEDAKKLDKCIIIEKYYAGYDYRILVIGNQVCAAARREPASVIGNGRNNIKELIDIENKNSLRGEDHEKALTKIKIDSIMKAYLEKNNISLDDVPPKGVKVILRPNANLSTGGKAVDCTEHVCEENKKIAIAAAREIGLGIAGIDIIARDISKPLYSRVEDNGNANDKNGAIIEVNAAPGIRMHLFPSSGYTRNVARNIVDYLFPKSNYENIPVISVTGTNGKTTTVRMLNEIFSQMGKKVGMTTTSGVYIDNKCVLKGDNTGYLSAKMVLTNKNVEVAVLETARGGILKRGLCYEAADVGVITNITEDHLGSDGIETIDQIAYVKSLVGEAVKSSGYTVLNADNPMTIEVSKRVKSPIIYFSKFIDNPLIGSHIKNNGVAVCLKDDHIIIIKSNMICKLMNIKDIPATKNGLVKCNIENSLAAVSAAIGSNVPVEFIKRGLQNFAADEKANPGRFNVFKIKDFHVMIDYGHNINGYMEVLDYINRLKCQRKIGIIGMPGDRRDSDIRLVSEFCGQNFDKVYIKEDKDLRGRKEGEVSQIMDKAIRSISQSVEINIQRYEEDALKLAIENAKSGDFIVVFYEDFEGVMACVNKYINTEKEIDKHIESVS